MTETEKYERLTNGAVKPLIVSLAVPTIFTMLISSFYNMADAMFVGTIDPQASGAISVVFSFMAIVQAFGFFFGHGSGNYISRMLGDKKKAEAETMASVGFFSALAFGTLIMIFGLIFLDPLCFALGSTPTIKPYAKDYLFYILLGAPYMTASLVLNNQLRFQGSAVYAMIGICSGGVINIGLDAWFIPGLGMGTGGAGLATAISQLIAFALLLAGTSRGGNIRLRVRSYRFRAFYYLEILRGGLPSLGRQGISSVATVCQNFACAAFLSAYVDETIAALGIVTKIMGFFSSAVIGFGQGFQPVCGFNYGAKKYYRLLEGYWFSVFVCTGFCLLIGGGGILFRKSIVPLFTNSAVVAEYAYPAFIAQCVAFAGFGYITASNMMLQNIGKVVPATLLASARQGLFFIPSLFLLGKGFGIDGIRLTQAIADGMTLIFSVAVTVPVVIALGREGRKQRSANESGRQIIANEGVRYE